MITTTNPASPANNNSPFVKGTLPSSGTLGDVRIYTNGNCNGAQALKRAAAKFTSTGIPTPVPADQTTTLTANVVIDGTISACSEPFTYVEDSTDPQTTIDSGPSGSTADATPTFAFSSSEPGSSFQCRFDSAAFGPCSGPGNTHTAANDLAAGSHVFEVRATDAAHNTDASPASQSFSVAGGTAPDKPVISATAPSSPANDNNPAVKGTLGGGDPVQVKVYASANCTGPATTGSVAAFTGAGIAITVANDTTTSISATALDAADNASPCSEPFTYVEDSTDPQTTIDSGPSGSTADATPTFAFSSSEPGSSFQCRFDSAAFGPCSGPGNTHTAANDLAAGSHVFEVRATDAAHNTDASPASQSFTVEGGAPPARPVITTTNPASPANNNSPFVKGTLPSSGTLGDVRIYTNGNCNGAQALKRAAAKFTSTGIPTPVPADQTTTLTANVVIDGTISACSEPFTYVEDSTDPQTTIDSGPSGSTADATPTFAFSSSEPGSSFQCRFDSAAFGPCSGPGNTHTAANDLAAGSHVFEVRATDAAHNTDASPASQSFSVAGGTAPDKPVISATAPSSPAGILAILRRLRRSIPGEARSLDPFRRAGHRERSRGARRKWQRAWRFHRRADESAQQRSRR